MIYQGTSTMNFYDLDGHGDVKLTALLRHINLSAGANAKELGIDLDFTLSLGLGFVIQRFALRMYKWPLYEETVQIRTWPAEITKGTFRRNGDMHSQDGIKMAEWTGLWVLFDINARKIKRPAALPVELPRYGAMGVNIEANRVHLPAGTAAPAASFIHTVRFTDMDTFMHMNNAFYGDLVANAIYSANPGVRASSVKEIQFNYLNETRIGDEIRLNTHFDTSQTDCYTYHVIGTVEGRNVFAAEVIFANP